MEIYKKKWWKWLGMALLLYVILVGLTHNVPNLAVLRQSIRNLYLHVPMWFGMVLLFLISLVYSIKYLRTGERKWDVVSTEFVNAGVLFGILGIITGSIWARFTWGAWWVNDTKLNSSAISLLIYLAYIVLRGSLEDPDQKGRISSVYNIFAFATMIPLIFILPRMEDSLHPGNGGNPAFGTYDLNDTMRTVFYPAVLGWFLLGVWVASNRFRIRLVSLKNADLL